MLSFFLLCVTFLYAKCDLSCDINDELRLAKLETRIEALQEQVTELSMAVVGVEALQRQIAALSTENLELETEMKVVRKKAEAAIAGCSSSWTIKRTQLTFPNLEKIALDQQTPTYVETIPVPFPDNTRAVIISVYAKVWNGGNSHAYLDLKIHQKGNDEGGMTYDYNTHYAVFANVFYKELFVPWDSTISNEMEFAVTRSKLTGGDSNFYRIRITGYVIA